MTGEKGLLRRLPFPGEPAAVLAGYLGNDGPLQDLYIPASPDAPPGKPTSNGPLAEETAARLAQAGRPLGYRVYVFPPKWRVPGHGCAGRGERGGGCAAADHEGDAGGNGDLGPARSLAGVAEAAQLPRHR